MVFNQSRRPLRASAQGCTLKSLYNFNFQSSSSVLSHNQLLVLFLFLCFSPFRYACSVHSLHVTYFTCYLKGNVTLRVFMQEPFLVFLDWFDFYMKGRVGKLFSNYYLSYLLKFFLYADSNQYIKWSDRKTREIRYPWRSQACNKSVKSIQHTWMCICMQWVLTSYIFIVSYFRTHLVQAINDHNQSRLQTP